MSRDLVAVLVFEDESGFWLVSPLKRSSSPWVRTPTIRTSMTYHARINLIGALATTSAAKGFDWAPNAIVIQSRSVREFIAAHSRVDVSHFSSYALKLNPMDFVCTEMSEFLAGRAPLQIS